MHKIYNKAIQYQEWFKLKEKIHGLKDMPLYLGMINNLNIKISKVIMNINKYLT